ncbi:MAG: hypothetical protein AAGG80_06820, partial [Pseudomonadota bacterium]
KKIKAILFATVFMLSFSAYAAYPGAQYNVVLNNKTNTNMSIHAQYRIVSGDSCVSHVNGPLTFDFEKGKKIFTWKVFNTPRCIAYAKSYYIMLNQEYSVKGTLVSHGRIALYRRNNKWQAMYSLTNYPNSEVKTSMISKGDSMRLSFKSIG